MGHAITENRNSLIMAVTVRPHERKPYATRLRMRQRQETPKYAISQKCRKRIEECFGWMKTVAGLVRTRLVGRWKLQQQMYWAAAAFNLIRMRNRLTK